MRPNKLLLAALALAALALVWRFPHSPAGVRPPEIALLAALPATILETIDATGVVRLQTGAEVRVGSRLSGLVDRIHVDVGDRVEAGDLLAELDDREIRAALEAAQARTEELTAQWEISRILLEKHRRANILPEAEITALALEAAAGEARLAQARAELENLRLRLSYTRVLAPIPGTVASVSTNQGETIAASFAAPTFLTIIDPERLEIQAYVDESDIGKVHPGQEVEFSVDAYPGAGFQGRVDAVQPKALIVNNVVNHVAVIGIEPRRGLPLRPEMTAHLRFLLEKRDGVLTVPRTALFSEEGAWFVALSGREGWERRQVEPGAVSGARIEISAGLEEGELFASDAEQWRRSMESTP